MIKTHFQGIQIIKQGKCSKHLTSMKNLMSMSVFLVKILRKHKIFMVQLDEDDELSCWDNVLSNLIKIHFHIL